MKGADIMDSFGKIAIAAVTAAVAVVAAKKIIDEISENPKDSRIVKGYEKLAGKVSELVGGKKKKGDWSVDFIDDDMDDAYTIDVASDDDDDFDGIDFDLSDTVEEVREKAEDVIEDVKEKVEDIAEEVKEKAEDIAGDDEKADANIVIEKVTETVEEFSIDFDQPEDGGMTEEELKDYLEEEVAQEQIDKILSEIDEAKKDEE